MDQNETIDKNVTSSNNEKNFDTQNSFQKTCAKTENKKPIETVSIPSLFRYATTLDIIYMLIGTTGGIGNGATFAVLLFLIGNLLNSFTARSTDICTLNFTALAIQYCPPGYQLVASNYFSSSFICHFNQTTFDFQGAIQKQILYVVIIGCICLVLSYIQVTFWSMAAERQTKAIRKKIFQSILRKEIVYFDIHKAGELYTKLTDNVDKIHDGIGDILGFIKGWKLTLAMLSLSPLLFISVALFSKLVSSLTAMELKAYGKAGAIAEEVFSSIRTVLSYNGQEREEKRRS
ncbi:unnamed protein product [Rotaria sordida]|uniref:ABC transmembrane type-1 domain-containing protein n=1 Tax=Rotaria sordida TaxID=392033 RepID=A0A816EZ79_9BILA|nr:unnamed protein product [Rotaria sordida]CAF1655679.1 unnamed protein product [Rotaria sordida]